MTEQWLGQSEDMLKRVEKLASEKDKDRLEIINSMIFALNVTNNSINGWRSWIQNLGFMSRFKEDELKEIEDGLLKLTRAFIEYDIEITKKHQDKLPRRRLSLSKRKKQRDSRGMYV
jgi:hypothetical protein